MSAFGDWGAQVSMFRFCFRFGFCRACDVFSGNGNTHVRVLEFACLMEKKILMKSSCSTGFGVCVGMRDGVYGGFGGEHEGRRGIYHFCAHETRLGLAFLGGTGRFDFSIDGMGGNKRSTRRWPSAVLGAVSTPLSHPDTLHPSMPCPFPSPSPSPSIPRTTYTRSPHRPTASAPSRNRCPCSPGSRPSWPHPPARWPVRVPSTL